MFAHLFSRRRVSAPHRPDVTDRRSGAPVGRRPDPMPRMRWYS
jgi:hypothetical protein